MRTETVQSSAAVTAVALGAAHVVRNLDEQGIGITRIVMAGGIIPAAMAAMQLGKHVIVEKPLAHNIWQLRTLQKAAKQYGVITQMANQGHATNGIRLIKEWYESG